MSYATTDNIKARYQEWVLIQITDPAGQAIQTAKITTALKDASAEMDSYLRGRYPLPLNPIPPELRGVCMDIAMYRLQTLRPAQDIEDARRRYEDALKWLRDVRDGKIDLMPEVDSRDDGTPGGTGAVMVAGPERVFSRDSLRGY